MNEHVYLLCRVCGSIEIVTQQVYMLWMANDVTHCGVQQKKIEPDAKEKKIPA